MFIMDELYYCLMLIALLVALIMLYALGYIHISGINTPNVQLFIINGQIITLWNILILLALATITGILPRPFREIASVLLILWILSTLGVIAITGLSSILVIAIIIGLLAYILGLF